MKPASVSARSVAGGLAICGAVLLGAPAGASDPSNTARVGERHFGDALDLQGWAGEPRDRGDDGLSLLHAGMLRTPSGALYPYPAEPRDMRSSGGAWSYEAVVGVGYAGTTGDDDALWFRQYTDWSDDPLAQFSLAMERAATGDYVEFRANRINSDNQYLRLRAGRAGKYRIEAFFHDLPHIISTTAYPIWQGIGSETLTLPATLTPGASTVADIAAASADAERQTIRVDRTRSGLSIEGDLARRWIGYLALSNEERDGTRLWGGPMFFAFIPNTGGVNETVRPIDFTTTDVSLGVRFVGQLWRFNVAYSGSFFRNHRDRLDYESPFTLRTVLGPAVPPAGVVGEGQFSLEPDNDAHNLQLDLSRSLPMNGELSLVLGAATMRQDDKLLAPVTCTGLGGIFIAPPADFTFNCADWNTPAALSTDSANARIDTQLLDLRVNFRPGAAFGWHAGIKHYSENNKTRYLAFNPLTGQYGYISENGSQGAVVPGETGYFDPSNPLFASYVGRIRNMPFEYAQTLAELGADWRLGDNHTLGATYTFDHTTPEHRERTRVDEHRLALAWTWAMTSGATLRASLEIADRTGDRYNFDPYEHFYSTSLPGFVVPAAGLLPHTVDAMRKYDLADRKQNKFRAILIQPVGTRATIAATFFGKYDDYDAVIGRRGAWTTGGSLQWDYQPGPKTTWNAWAGYDYSHLRMVNVADNEANLTAGEVLGGGTFPLANLWSEDDREDSYHAGSTFRHDFGRVTLDLAYSFVYTKGDVGYDYASPGAVAGIQQPFIALVGNGFPGNHYRTHAIDLGLTATLTARLAGRLFARYETGSFRDFHYDGLEDSLVYGHRVYTDRGPARDFDASLIGLMFNYRL